MNHSNDGHSERESRDCGCGSEVDRRTFLRLTSAGTLALFAGRAPVMAGPFEVADFQKLVPAEKKLHPEWIKSLFERGEPEFYTGSDLKYIGMPVGGICAGHLYLGGDGKLWLWDIFNQNRHTGDKDYSHPGVQSSPLQQGFSIRIGTAEYALDATGFSEVTFNGQYPIARVAYKDPLVPLIITLESYSPFIPLDTDNSSLPATVLQYTLSNTSSGEIEAALTGTIENAMCRSHANFSAATRQIRVIQESGITFLECSIHPVKDPQTDRPPNISLDSERNPENAELEVLPDFGTMGLALLGDPADIKSPGQSVPLQDSLTGKVGRKLTLHPGQSITVTFVITWCFPNLTNPGVDNGRYYSAKFESALAVAQYLATHFQSLDMKTRLWRDTWYDSTLPYWFLDRTFLNTSILATSTCHRYKDGRFWAWEGVGCCKGTCTHVWHYAQAMSRIFPDIERDTRERVDMGIALDPTTGVSGFRAENDRHLAVDGQSGTILRIFREHQMSTNDAFLKRNWNKVKLMFKPLFNLDPNADGVLEGAQMNTLDRPWYGSVSWLSSMYLAALRAGEAMATEMGEIDFAARCKTIIEKGSAKIDRELFNGEYYYQIGDPSKQGQVGSYDGCEIDQVLGQGWLFQVGLDRILPIDHTNTALASIWKYNFTPDAGIYRAAKKPGRWYAMAGEAGVIMCTWPRGEENRVPVSYDFYFNECMNGFEHQLAGHMIWEGMVLEGLAIERAIHDRYHPSKRNPWNEIECGDHYARSMASYGVFLAACGYEYHGPKGHLGFAPRLTPDDFKAPFTTAEGWGSFSQKRTLSSMEAVLSLKFGALRLNTIRFVMAQGAQAKKARVKVGESVIPATLSQDGEHVLLSFATPLVMHAGQSCDFYLDSGPL